MGDTGEPGKEQVHKEGRPTCHCHCPRPGGGEPQSRFCPIQARGCEKQLCRVPGSARDNGSGVQVLPFSTCSLPVSLLPLPCFLHRPGAGRRIRGVARSRCRMRKPAHCCCYPLLSLAPHAAATHSWIRAGAALELPLHLHHLRIAAAGKEGSTVLLNPTPHPPAYSFLN